jgi:membrane protease YdiL (CAAX protease family)
MSILLCIGFVLCTQVPAAILGGVVLVAIMIVAPEEFPRDTLTNTKQLLNTRAGSIMLGVAFSAAQVLVIGVSWLALRLIAGRDWMRQVALRLPGLLHFILVLAAFPAMVLLANGAYDLLKQLGVPSMGDWGLEDMEKMVTVFSSWPWQFAVLVIGLGPGIGEELWCRAFLGRGLVGRYGVVLGVLATSFFFGLIHIDPRQGTMAALMGLWLHFVYLTTRALLMPMLLHFLNNSLAVIITRFPQAAALEQKPGELPVLLFGAAGVLLVTIAWALFRSRARLAPVEGAVVLWQPSYPGVEYPPPTSGVEVVHPRPTWDAVIAALIGVGVFATACVVAARGG